MNTAVVALTYYIKREEFPAERKELTDLSMRNKAPCLDNLELQHFLNCLVLTQEQH
jgi:hypothetical protein